MRANQRKITFNRMERHSIFIELLAEPKTQCQTMNILWPGSIRMFSQGFSLINCCNLKHFNSFCGCCWLISNCLPWLVLDLLRIKFTLNVEEMLPVQSSPRNSEKQVKIIILFVFYDPLSAQIKQYLSSGYLLLVNSSVLCLWLADFWAIFTH